MEVTKNKEIDDRRSKDFVCTYIMALQMFQCKWRQAFVLILEAAAGSARAQGNEAQA